MDLIPEPQIGKFLLVALPHGSAGLLLRLAARLALRSTAAPAALRALDCGNRFNAYKLALELRRQGALPVEPLLKRIFVARAFTCYQVLTLLETSPAAPTPTLVLDLLATFRDESAPLHERRRLLQEAVFHLQRLAQAAPLLVSATPHGAPPDELLEAVEQAAGQVWRFAPPPPALPARWF